MGLRVTDSNSKVLATILQYLEKKKRTLAQKCAASVIV